MISPIFVGLEPKSKKPKSKINKDSSEAKQSKALVVVVRPCVSGQERGSMMVPLLLALVLSPSVALVATPAEMAKAMVAKMSK